MIRMDQIKFVIDELNQAPFVKQLNLIAYDGLRSEQRLDILIQILNTIDPKLGLPSVRVGNIEEIATTILDTLRIFKYVPPNLINPGEFRRDLILGDKELLTNIFYWLLTRMSALKKRAYLARFLVKIELSPEVEGDHDVVLIYQQYLRLIEEFKKAHSNYEKQKKSLDSLIELQKDIKTMEFEKDQIRNKLETVRRRVNFDSDSSEPNAPLAMFEATKRYAEMRAENEKLQKQLRQQAERIESTRARIETQQLELADYRSNDILSSGHPTPDSLLSRLEEDVAIKQRLAKEVLPNELEELQSLVSDIERISQQPDSLIKEYLSKTRTQIESLNREIADLMEHKILNRDSDQDRLSHYRQNAKSVAEKKEATLKRHMELEGKLRARQSELEQIRAQFNDGDLPVRGEALKLYIEKISKREIEMQEKTEQLAALSRELRSLETKLADLKRQDAQALAEIGNLEESVGIEGYFRMKEHSLAIVVDDNSDGMEDSGVEFTNDDIEPINAHIVRLEETLDNLKEGLAPLVREVKQLKQVAHELENEFDMKKRLYEAAAAGLETELSRSEAELERLKREKAAIEAEQFHLQTELLVGQSERDWLTMECGPSGTLVDKLKKEIEQEEKLHQTLKEREKESATKADYYRKQIDMWRDLKALFEIKSRILTEKREEKARAEYMISANYNHLVL